VQDWAAIHPDALGDDLSFIPADATSTTHTTAALFSAALTTYDPDLASMSTSYGTLAAALDAVSETAPQIGMKRVVLYITSVPGLDSIPAIENLTRRATDQGIRVHVWIVASPDYFSASGATALKDLAIKTGGQSTLFSGKEVLPSIETYLAPVRHSYTFTYASSLRASGSHSLSAQINNNGEMLASSALSFDLSVEPPNPILVTPPAQLVRQGADPRDNDFALFQPVLQPIEIIFEFPDGHPRPLVRSAFYVDGVLAGENTADPFERFIWDLSGYTQSGEHTLQVEATDSLGLTSVSIGVPVTVTVVQPERGLVAFLARNRLWVALGAMVIAGGVLTIILVFGRRKRQMPMPPRYKRDPLTQPVEAGPVGKRKGLLRTVRPVKQSEASLLRLKEDGQAIAAAPIPVTTPEMTFGSDPIRATRILDDPSVSALHARLTLDSDGGYTLRDENSISGTWVNFEQLTTPRRLAHGDVLHIGRLSYRFMLEKPPEQPAPRLISDKP
jgi:hypothetical protein